VIVRWEPPRTATTVPPTTAPIIPEIGGIPEAIASPSPKGRAIKDTTKPENIFAGSALNHEADKALLMANN
jgi:hypothetical protein